jgi:WD40 repeat protein/tRNA A-37 threonylcarbamoyl transferase component Bud32
MAHEALGWSDRAARLTEVIHDYLRAVDQGRVPDREELLRRHSDLASDLAAFFADQDRLDQVARNMRSEPPAEPPTLPPESQPSASSILGTVRYFGDYELLEEIARGGMGVVYKARQVSLNRIVALKMILAGQLASEADVKRFRTEAEAAANLDHPNIVPIYEVGEHQGQHYFSMKYVEGGCLSDQVPRLVHEPRETARLVVQVARAVHHAHQRGILHRDLKPGNVLLDTHGEPHVTDFGLARKVEGGSDLTRTGAIVGTPSYMAPEQARAEKGLTTAVDVYALGAILYELLTGRAPFRAETPLDTALQVIEREPVRPRALNPFTNQDLETVCLKCLEKEPGRRYDSAAALGDDLQRWLADEPIAARRSTAPERIWKWAKRRPAAAALVGVIATASLILLGGTLGFTVWLRWALSQTEEQRDVARVQEGRAKDREVLARRLFYGSDVNLAWQAWEKGQLGRVQQLLDRHRPEDDGEDVRGFEWYFLWRLCHSDRLTLAAHPESVHAVAWSTDGKILATAGERAEADPARFHGARTVGEIKLWDPATGLELATLQGHQAPVKCLAFSPDGGMLASGSGGNEEEGRDFTVRLWDVASRNTRLVLSGFSGEISSLAFSADARLLAVGFAGMREQARLCDTATGEEKFTIPAGAPGSGARIAVGLSNDGRILATGSSLWDAASGKPLPGLSGDRGNVTALAFPPSSTSVLALGGADGTVQLWDVTAKSRLSMVDAHAGGITALAFSSDGARIASAGRDQKVMLWEVVAKPSQLRRSQAFEGHTDVVSSVAFSPDGKELVSGSFDGTAKFWELAPRRKAELSERPAEAPKAPPPPPAAPPFAGRPLLASLSPTPERQEWLAPAELQDVLNPQGVAFSTDSRLLVVADQEGAVRLWDLLARRVGPRLAGARLPVACGPDGKTLATGHANGTVKVWDPTTGRDVSTIRPPEGRLAGLLYSPDGSELAITTTREVAIQEPRPTVQTVSTVSFHDPSTGRERMAVRGDGLWRSVALSPDGKTLAAADYVSSSVELYDAQAGGRRGSFRAHDRGLEHVAFSPDGRTLATAGFGRKEPEIKLWDPGAARERATLRGHAGIIKSLSFAPDGHTLATASLDGTVSLWCVGTAQQLLAISVYAQMPGPLQEHAVLNAMAFSPDGRFLATAGDDILESAPRLILWRAATKEEVTARTK